MLKTIKEVLRTGNATIAYPFAPLHQYDDYRGKPQHIAENCIACGACMQKCPQNIRIPEVMQDFAATLKAGPFFGPPPEED